MSRAIQYLALASLVSAALLGSRRADAVARRPCPMQSCAQRAPGRALLVATRLATIHGVVYDSLHARPLAGAKVIVVGTMHLAETDSSGAFRIDSVPTGSQQLTFFHPLLDSLGVGAVATHIELSDGDDRMVTLAVPSARTLIASICGALPGQASSAVLGSVYDVDGDRPIPGARITVGWDEWTFEKRSGYHTTFRTATVVADGEGVYRACGVPSQTVALQASHDGASSGVVQLLARDTSLTVQDFSISPSEGADSTERTAAGSELTGMSDKRARATGSAVLEGVVTDASTHAAMSGAEVQVLGGGARAATDRDGNFVLRALPAGTRTLEVRRIGFLPTRKTIELRRGRIAYVALTLEARAHLLDSVRIVAKRSPQAAAGATVRDRMATAGGQYVTRSQIEARNASHVVDLMRGIPGIEIVNQGSGPILVYSHGQEDFRSLCYVTVLIDGVEIPESERKTLDLDRWLRPNEIETVEFYTADRVPIQYMKPGSTCGVALFWTRGSAPSPNE